MTSFFLTLLSSVFIAKATPLHSGVELDAWMDLFQSTGGDQWVDCSEHHDTPCQCRATIRSHPRVTCNTEEDSIISLDLSENQLVGSIPASIGNFSNLKYLSIGGAHSRAHPSDKSRDASKTQVSPKQSQPTH